MFSCSLTGFNKACCIVLCYQHWTCLKDGDQRSDAQLTSTLPPVRAVLDINNGPADFPMVVEPASLSQSGGIPSTNTRTVVCDMLNPVLELT